MPRMRTGECPVGVAMPLRAVRISEVSNIPDVSAYAAADGAAMADYNVLCAVRQPVLPTRKVHRIKYC